MKYLHIYSWRPRSARAAKLLGFDDYIPPFAGASSQQLLTGVNFASAAAGIREETGQQLVYTACARMHCSR